MFCKSWIKQKAVSSYCLRLLEERFFSPSFSTSGQSSKHESKPNKLSLVYSVNYGWLAVEKEYANQQNPEIILKHNLNFSSQSLSWHSKPFSRTVKEAWLSFSIIARPPQVEPLTISEMDPKKTKGTRVSKIC